MSEATGTPIVVSRVMYDLVGHEVRGTAHGGTPFEGELIAIADKPQAVVRDEDGNVHHLTIETIRDLEVKAWQPANRS